MRPRSDQRQIPKMQVISKAGKKKVNRKRKQPLDVFFSPKTVAVIGATENLNTVGRTVLWNLVTSPFGGTVYPVNPKRPSVLGVKAYPTISDIPEEVELAVIITPPPGPAPEGMVWIPGGEFSMGSDLASESLCGLPGVTRDAVPIHRVFVDGFWMEKTDVTNDKFQEFVNATGYVTIAERAPTREEFPGAPPENLVAGSTVFTPTPGPVPLNNHFQWWRYQHGANWRHLEGPDTDLRGKEKYPVVHIAYPDAVAYAVGG